MNASNSASYSLFTLWWEIMSLFEATGHIGLPYLYLGFGFAKKPFFYFSSLVSAQRRIGYLKIIL